MKTIEVIGNLSAERVRALIKDLEDRAVLLRTQAGQLPDLEAGVAEHMRVIARVHEDTARWIAEESRRAE